MPPFHPFRPATCLVLAAAACACWTGCKPSAAPKPSSNQTQGEGLSSSPATQVRRPPGTAELADYVRSGLPPVLRLVELKNDPPVRLANSAPGSDAWTYNVRLTFAPVEDELGPPPPQVTAAFRATLDELSGLVAWSQAYAKSPYATLYPGFTVESPTPAAPQLLTVLHAKDRPRPPIYAKMAAEWQVDHWEFSMQGVALPTDEGGQFRNEYTGPILIQGDPATGRFIAAAKAAIAEAEPKRQAIEAAYQADLQKVTRPGTVYKGSISFGSTSTPAEVRFIDSPVGDSSFARFELRLPATGYVYTASARLAWRVPNIPLAAANPVETTTAPPDPAPKADLTIGYEHIAIPKPYPQNEFATNFLYHARETRDAPLNVSHHQLKGQVGTTYVGPSFVLSAQQSP